MQKKPESPQSLQVRNSSKVLGLRPRLASEGSDKVPVNSSDHGKKESEKAKRESERVDKLRPGPIETTNRVQRSNSGRGSGMNSMPLLSALSSKRLVSNGGQGLALLAGQGARQNSALPLNSSFRGHPDSPASPGSKSGREAGHNKGPLSDVIAPTSPGSGTTKKREITPHGQRRSREQEQGLTNANAMGMIFPAAGMRRSREERSAEAGRLAPGQGLHPMHPSLQPWENHFGEGSPLMLKGSQRTLSPFHQSDPATQVSQCKPTTRGRDQRDPLALRG
mmetsp:Transcript_56021/g.114518  ORF Transcript_56021/g.114518 Transcript_56021/m.114518 type:complete len:279 (-) Transcript_56021:275-1111(-)